MVSPLRSLIAAGTKLWLDSIDPDLVQTNRKLGATGATSNPVIVSDLIKTGRFDSQMQKLIDDGLDDDAIAWQLTDQLVRRRKKSSCRCGKRPAATTATSASSSIRCSKTRSSDLPHAERVARYIELGKKWSAGHKNRMIKVPATPAGLDALEELVAAGITLNVTLIFSPRQYAPPATPCGAARSGGKTSTTFKSVYSIFVSRVDVYTEKHVPAAVAAAQGQVGIVNAKRIWAENQTFWKQTRSCRSQQEMIFASTGTKKPEDPPWKYVEAFAGSDIETNPPATNDAVAKERPHLHAAGRRAAAGRGARRDRSRR